jgi:3-phosphoshikimate 1-carboxyvinyltransferase
MTTYIVEPARKPLLGHVKVPGDKSIAHRALLFGGLCEGRVLVQGVSAGADNGRSARAMNALGVTMTRQDGALVIHGVGLRGLRAPAHDLDCGNSGTTMRLLCGLLAGQAFATTLVGDESLSSRPMRRVIDPLAGMGATITGQAGARPGEVYPPLCVHGVAAGGAAGRALRAIDYALPMASAQVKSAILLAGLYADGATTVREPGPSRDHTERMLARMGAPVRASVHAGARDAGGGGAIELDTRGWDGRLGADRIVVPGDPSQAAFVIAAGLIAGVERITVGEVCINPTRTGFLDVLAAMGALIEREAMSPARGELDEPRADLSMSRAIRRTAHGAGNRSGSRGGDGNEELAATIIAGELTVRSIDELPILAVVAARAAGTTEIRDAGELRVKESDRIATTCELLRALGVEVEERPGGMIIQGVPGRRFRGARVHARGDHRIAMSAAVAGLAAEGAVRVDGAECVATSFPDFPEVLRALGAEIAVEA